VRIQLEGGWNIGLEHYAHGCWMFGASQVTGHAIKALGMLAWGCAWSLGKGKVKESISGHCLVHAFTNFHFVIILSARIDDAKLIFECSLKDTLLRK
jgi:hypothetical protein